MENSYKAGEINPQSEKKKLLKEQVKRVFVSQNLDNQRRLIKAIATELKITVFDCAAAIVYLHENNQLNCKPNDISQQIDTENRLSAPSYPPQFKQVRYRLDLGSQHNVTLENIKKVLVDESGVDIKNITNVRIQDSYTLMDLPDEMPQEIFHHLKTVEINGQKLDIKRVKARNKKRYLNRNQRNAAKKPAAANEASQ